jgi:hypothetical protein
MTRQSHGPLPPTFPVRRAPEPDKTPARTHVAREMSILIHDRCDPRCWCGANQPLKEREDVMQGTRETHGVREMGRAAPRREREAQGQAGRRPRAGRSAPCERREAPDAGRRTPEAQSGWGAGSGPAGGNRAPGSVLGSRRLVCLDPRTAPGGRPRNTATYGDPRTDPGAANLNTPTRHGPVTKPGAASRNTAMYRDLRPNSECSAGKDPLSSPGSRPRRPQARTAPGHRALHPARPA